MLTQVTVKDFAAIPYLETSALMQNHPKGIKFSTKKPNVIVGPNGAGKSALMHSLALHTLSFFTGISSLDNNFTSRGSHSDQFWTKADRWSKNFDFLKGLVCKSDDAPALFYRPGHIPGNDDSIGAAMFCGYSKEARAYGNKVDKKSSGQGSQACLENIKAALDGDISGIAYRQINWDFGIEPTSMKGRGWIGDWDHQAEILKDRVRAVAASAIPVIFLDEPEQSLDALAEAKLWRQISQADCSKLQVIAATHSLYPLMHPDQFNIIEAVPGYAAEVVSLL